MLIDCGVNKNFISEKVVSTLQIPTKETVNYGINLKSKLKSRSDSDQGYLIGCRVLEGEIIIERFCGVDKVSTTRNYQLKQPFKECSMFLNLSEY